jgi:hypothetical protein
MFHLTGLPMKGLFLCLILLTPLACLADTQAVSVLLDMSRSIPPEQFSRAKEITEQMYVQAGPDDTISVYAFGNSLRRVARNDLGSLTPSDSYTYLYDAIIDAARELDKTSASRKAIVIITDGIDTKSATTIEDSMQFAESHGIAIHTIGIGKVSDKSLQRMSKLTSGSIFDLNDSTVAENIRSTIASQRLAQPAMQPVTTVPPVVQQQTDPDPSTVQEPTVTAPPQTTRQARRQTGLMARYGYLLWIAGAGLIAIPVVLWVVTRAFKKETRSCPTCGRTLEDYETVCPDCTSSQTAAPAVKAPVEELAMEATQQTRQIKRPHIPLADDLPSFPPEVLMKPADSDELLSRTFVLMDKPLLIVRKGKNLGQAFALDRSVPVSIGRSRVCEIRLEDVTVSGQHCRIISEDGKHYLYDLRSTNGTFVNDKKVRKVELKEGDIIKVGETYFLYKVEQQRS